MSSVTLDVERSINASNITENFSRDKQGLKSVLIHPELVKAIKPKDDYFDAKFADVNKGNSSTVKKKVIGSTVGMKPLNYVKIKK